MNIKAMDFYLLLKMWFKIEVKKWENVSSNYNQKLLRSAKKSATGGLEAVSKQSFQKRAEVTINLIDIKTANAIKRTAS